MNRWVLALLLTTGILFAAVGQTPPPKPWFTKPLVQFLSNPQLTCLGWSKTGKVALLVPVDGGGRGGAVVRMVLVDTVEDNLLSDVEQWGDEFDLASDEVELLARNMEISQAGMDFLYACLEADIVPVATKQSSFLSFPLTFQGLKLSAKAVTNPTGDKDEFGSQPLDYRIVATSVGRGEKTIARSQVSHAFAVTVEGYFLSPVEARMLVVYSLTQPGFEGERPKTYFFSGCHLKSGFTKK